MKPSDKVSIASFKEKLDNEYDWPALYTFKFIVPSARTGEVKSLFSNHETTEKASSHGKHTSVTAKIMADSSDTIIEYYLKASKIEGVIAL